MPSRWSDQVLRKAASWPLGTAISSVPQPVYAPTTIPKQMRKAPLAPPIHPPPLTSLRARPLAGDPFVPGVGPVVVGSTTRGPGLFPSLGTPAPRSPSGDPLCYGLIGRGDTQQIHLIADGGGEAGNLIISVPSGRNVTISSAELLAAGLVTGHPRLGMTGRIRLIRCHLDPSKRIVLFKDGDIREGIRGGTYVELPPTCGDHTFDLGMLLGDTDWISLRIYDAGLCSMRTTPLIPLSWDAIASQIVSDVDAGLGRLRRRRGLNVVRLNPTMVAITLRGLARTESPTQTGDRIDVFCEVDLSHVPTCIADPRALLQVTVGFVRVEGRFETVCVCTRLRRRPRHDSSVVGASGALDFDEPEPERFFCPDGANVSQAVPGTFDFRAAVAIREVETQGTCAVLPVESVLEMARGVILTEIRDSTEQRILGQLNLDPLAFGIPRTVVPGCPIGCTAQGCSCSPDLGNVCACSTTVCRRWVGNLGLGLEPPRHVGRHRCIANATGRFGHCGIRIEAPRLNFLPDGIEVVLSESESHPQMEIFRQLGPACDPSRFKPMTVGGRLIPRRMPRRFLVSGSPVTGYTVDARGGTISTLPPEIHDAPDAYEPDDVYRDELPRV